MRKVTLAVALVTVLKVSVAWAVPILGPAHLLMPRGGVSTRSPSDGAGGELAGGLVVRFREVRGLGLLVDSWINESGPFVFAIDTGAGVSIISRRVVEKAGLAVRTSRHHLLGGLSTAPISTNQGATVVRFAIGRPDNVLAAVLTAAVAPHLPGGVDGILDPLEVSPWGYSIDLPNRQLEIFGANVPRLRAADTSEGGATVSWVRERGGQRPFVKLGDGRLALLDTGSGFGLAVNVGRQTPGMNPVKPVKTVRDLGGGVIQSRRVEPATISIGALVLRSVPTDVLTGVAPGTPLILGRDALYPFKLTFDPIARLISIEPVEGR